MDLVWEYIIWSTSMYGIESPAQCCKSIPVEPGLSPKHCAHFQPIFPQADSGLVSVWRGWGRGGPACNHCSSHIWRKTSSFEKRKRKNTKSFCILKKIFFPAHVLGSLIFLRFSSAFSSPMPTWQPRASRVLWTQPANNNSVEKRSIPLKLGKHTKSSSELT